MNRASSMARSIACATLLFAAACSAPTVPTEEPPLAGARIGGPFTLTDTRGERVTERDFAGRYRLMYFGYSFCPDVCPVDLNNLMLGLKAFERRDPAAAARVVPIFVTIDPERDTPAVLATYVRQFHPRLVGLTGSAAEIRDTARKFVVQYQKQPGSSPEAYLMGHSNIAYLMGPDGAPIALLPVDKHVTADVNEGAPDAVADELARWVR